MTDEELTAIYNGANGLDPKRHNPITTERIFAAMRAAILVEREACAKVCDVISDESWKLYRKKYHPHDEGFSDGAAACADDIRKRSKAKVSGAGTASAGLPG